MRVSMLVASEEATAGSVIRKAERISPSSSGFSQRVLLLGRAVAMQHFHVAGVGGRAVEHLRGPAHPAHLLGAQGVFEVGQAGAAILGGVVILGRRHEQVPKTRGSRLGLQLLEDGGNLPAIGAEGAHLGVVGLGRRPDVGVHEVADAVAPLALSIGEGEVHRGRSWVSTNAIRRALWGEPNLRNRPRSTFPLEGGRVGDGGVGSLRREYPKMGAEPCLDQPEAPDATPPSQPLSPRGGRALRSGPPYPVF